MDWINLAQNRDMSPALVKCSNELLGSLKCGEFFDKLRNS